MSNIHAKFHVPSKCQTLVIVGLPDSLYSHRGKYNKIHVVTLTLADRAQCQTEILMFSYNVR